MCTNGCVRVHIRIQPCVYAESIRESLWPIFEENPCGPFLLAATAFSRLETFASSSRVGGECLDARRLTRAAACAWLEPRAVPASTLPETKRQGATAFSRLETLNGTPRPHPIPPPPRCLTKSRRESCLSWYARGRVIFLDMPCRINF